MLSRRSFVTLAGVAPFALQAKSSQYYAYFGCYTRKTSKGIHVSKFDPATGQLTEAELAAEVGNPSFVAIHPTNKYLYAVTEAGQEGAVTSFSIDRASGKLTKINQASSKGGGPCHLNVDRTGRSLVVANYNSGSTACLPVHPDGSLGESTSFVQHKGTVALPKRQGGPHAHSANISSNNKFLIVADLGLDQMLVYKLDPAKATITPNDPPFAKLAPGLGPRHFVFHPKNKFGYAINEIACSVTGFKWDGNKGTLTEIETVSTLPTGVSRIDKFSTAEVRVHPSGKFLYGSNRGHNTIVVYTIDQGTGKLTHVDNTSTEGEIPRNFNIDPTGKWLLAANQNSDSVVVFSIDPASGRLKPTGQKLKVDTPVCIRFVPV